MITDGGNNAIEVKMGGLNFRIGVEIIGHHIVPVFIFGLIEMKRHRILAVIEVIDREDQFMLEPAFRLA